MTAQPGTTRRLIADDVDYLALEGGGGKGFAFLGAVQALEELGIVRHFIAEPEPDFQRVRLKWMPSDIPARRRLALSDSIKGVAGASAGAITALLLSCGYSAADILSIMRRFPFDTLFEPPRERFVPRIQVDRNSADYSGAVRLPSGQPKEGPIYREIRNRVIRSLLSGDLKGAGEAELELRWLKFLASVPTYVNLGALLTGASLPAAVRVLMDGFPYFVSYLPEDMGFFPGYAARKFFAELIAFKMPKRDGRFQYNATFRDHFDYFNIQLAVTGTNLETKKSGIFSVDTTEHFPVADAVRISMSLPLVYKPYVIRSEHYPKGLLDDWVNGVWVDGGYLNNIPLRAFDRQGGIGRTLGLRLNPADEERKDILSLWDFLTVWPLAFGFLGAGEAHIGPGTRTDLETIILDTKGLDLLVFSPPQDVIESVTKSSKDAVLTYFSG